MVIALVTKDKGGAHLLTAFIKPDEIGSPGQRFRRFDHAPCQTKLLRRKPLAAEKTTTCKDLTAVFRGHAAAETMAALTDKAARLKCTLHETQTLSNYFGSNQGERRDKLSEGRWCTQTPSSCQGMGH